MRLTSDWHRDMLAIMARVAPEITQPPYLVRPEDLPGLPSPIETRAYATPDPSPAQRQALHDAGVWRGSAPLIVFVEPLSDRLEAYGRFVHELSHLLPFTPAADTHATLSELTADKNRVAAWAAVGNAADDLPRWAPHHGRQFLRVASHLWYRTLELCSLDIPQRCIVHHEYDLSPLAAYIDALMPELRATPTDMPFAAIVALPMSKHFSNLFERDKAAWLRQHEAKNEPNP